MNKKEQGALDSAAEKSDSSESNPESPNPVSPEQETPVKAGLVARIKLKLTSFTRRFRKTPAFQAGEDYASNAHDISKSAPDSTPATKSDSKQSEPETPEKPGLVAKIKSGFAALVLRFKKAPAPDAAEDQNKDTRSRSKDESKNTEETPGEIGLVERVKSSLGAFISLHKKLLIFTLLLLSLIAIIYAAWNIIFPPLERKHSSDKTPAHESMPPEQPQIEVETPKKKSEEEQAHTEAPKKDSSEQTRAGAEVLKKKSEEEPGHTEVPKKDSSEQAQAEAEALMNKSEDAQALAEALKKESEDAQAQAETLKKQSGAAQARAEELRKKEAEEKARTEALKKKEAEDKARAEALKKSSRQPPSLDSSNRPTGGSAVSPPISGEITVDNSKDPKATAKSLKEAIEAMNVGSDGPPKKSAK